MREVVKNRDVYDQGKKKTQTNGAELQVGRGSSED